MKLARSHACVLTSGWPMLLRNRFSKNAVLRTGEAKDTLQSLDWPWAFRTPFVFVDTENNRLLFRCKNPAR